MHVQDKKFYLVILKMWIKTYIKWHMLWIYFGIRFHSLANKSIANVETLDVNFHLYESVKNVILCAFSCLCAHEHMHEMHECMITCAYVNYECVFPDCQTNRRLLASQHSQLCNSTCIFLLPAWHLVVENIFISHILVWWVTFCLLAHSLTLFCAEIKKSTNTHTQSIKRKKRED